MTCLGNQKEFQMVTGKILMGTYGPFIHSFIPQFVIGILLCAKCEAHHYEDEAREADVIMKSLVCGWKE